MKKTFFVIFVLMMLCSCSGDDEHFWKEYFQNLLYENCTDGTYEGIIRWNNPKDKIGLWCEVTILPDDAEPLYSPDLGGYVYINRNLFPNRNIASGTAIRFQVIDYSAFRNLPETFPYNYLLPQNRCYWIANIKLLNDISL